VSRTVSVTAVDEKQGMTAVEMLQVLKETPDHVRPVVKVNVRGRVRKISFTISEE
jgi:hypothetical protein